MRSLRIGIADLALPLYSFTQFGLQGSFAKVTVHFLEAIMPPGIHHTGTARSDPGVSVTRYGENGLLRRVGMCRSYDS